MTSTERLPDGQVWLERPIVYDIGPVPPLDLEAFRLTVHGAVLHPMELTWKDLLAFPTSELVRDFHCVTTWSVKNIRWEGVRTKEIVDRVLPDPEALWIMARGRDGYSTSMPAEDFRRPDSLLAFHMNGVPLAPDHGWPLRLVIPSLYAWKSAKYVCEIEFLSRRQRGFWEERGYHDRGDPWREERYRT